MIKVFSGHNDIINSIINIIQNIENEGIHSQKVFVERKGPSDFFTNIDTQIERNLINALKKIDDIPCLSEESSPEVYGNNYWVIDPIDGTTNFIHNYPSYCLSIAKVENGCAHYGFVYNLATKELFVGIKNHGAQLYSLKSHKLTPKNISVSNTKLISDSIVAFGCPYDKTKTEQLFRISNNILKKCHDLKRNGPASLDICYVACGRLDAYYEFDLKEWDYRAAKLILEEAGGILTDWNGRRALKGQNNIAASNVKVHKELLEFLHD